LSNIPLFSKSIALHDNHYAAQEEARLKILIHKGESVHKWFVPFVIQKQKEIFF